MARTTATSPRRAGRRGLLLSLALLVLVSGCEKTEVEEVEPPLRTLVYTETPGFDPDKAVDLEEHVLTYFQETNQIPSKAESAAWLARKAQEENAQQPDPEAMGALLEELGEGEDAVEVALPTIKRDANLHLRSPEALAEAAFKAMVEQDATLYDQVFVDADGLIALAKLKEDTARKRAGLLRRKSRAPFDLFDPGSASEAPRGGLATKVALKEIEIGKAGDIWGRPPKEDSDVVQHWGNLITFKLTHAQSTSDNESLFTISLGRMLRLPDGEWRLAAPPEVSSSFRQYLSAGFHLKPELMQPEHFPFPLSVGNFWRYRIKRASAGEEALVEQDGEAVVEEVRIEVTEVDKHDGYRIVTLMSTHKRREATSETFRYLITPRRIYPCSSYCRYKANDFNYLMGYVRTQTPLLIFPLIPGLEWKSGGVKVSKGGRYNVRERSEQVVVPAGEFHGSLVVSGKRGGTYITRYFKPGVGVVQRVVRGPSDTRVEELIEYRILATE